MGVQQFSTGRLGEAVVVTSPKANGWTVTSWDTKGAGSTDIGAQMGRSKILVQVKSAIAPRQPAGLSGDACEV